MEGIKKKPRNNPAMLETAIACVLYCPGSTMDYLYETLDEHRFQKLAQALVVAEYPTAQCLPVSQPDGGRDAFRYHASPDSHRFTVFQVKFSRDPRTRSSRDAILSLIASETPKVKKLITRGADRYVLITNVSGTAHLDSGSIDRANRELREAFDIPCQIWWRDDLDGRLTNQPDVGWHFPEILRATEILPFLVNQPGEIQHQQSAQTITSYVASQYHHDREIKFKQVELKRSLVDLFVDLPIQLKRLKKRYDGTHETHQLVGSAESDSYLRDLEESVEDTRRLAGAFFLGIPLQDHATRFVLEGAPGQGKSTVTQFICQMDRMRLLKKSAELDRVGNTYMTGPLRTPFRLDLRDYAEWINGRHPYVADGQGMVAVDVRGSLESFIAMQVGWVAGSQEFTQDTLLAFFQRSHCVIVLDGFDEVADIGTRTRMVEEIGGAAERLEARALSVQLIVTSRPAAFANSPGFPRSDWVHVELKDLKIGHIGSYKDKWTEAQGLSVDERRMVSSTLDTKLEQPHLRDLARNPMQLAILLHLIHVPGVALPEKRTTLYEEYMKLFFNREAEKSPIVRDHRELIMAIHGELAWRLHVQTEEGKGTGSFTKDALHSAVRGYLISEEHDPELVDPLMAGAVERVGALVSRVVGTFEFEVQPLREYFAARHLYTTAPYSPPGRGLKGTRPDRFDALVRSSYWTNVTRFFCGFYDVGEIGTLVDGLTYLDDEPGYGLVNQPRRIALMLLSDHVFSQSPKTIKRLLEHVITEPGFERLLQCDTLSEVGLPEKAGRDILFSHCLRMIQVDGDNARRSQLRLVMAANGDRDRLVEIWLQRHGKGQVSFDDFVEALDLSVAGQIPTETMKSLTAHDPELRMRWLTLIDRYEHVVNDPDLRSAAYNALFDGTMVFIRPSHRKTERTQIEILSAHLNVYGLARLFLPTSDKRRTVSAAMMDHYVVGAPEAIDELNGATTEIHDDRISPFTSFVVEHMSKDVSLWNQEIAPWEVLVDKGLELSSGGFLFAQMAVIATAIDGFQELGKWSDEGFAPTPGLVRRLHFARGFAEDASWWESIIEKTTEEDSVIGLAVLLSWGTGAMLPQVMQHCRARVDGLKESEWLQLRETARLVEFAASDRRPELDEGCFSEVITQSARLSLILLGRVKDDEIRRKLSRRIFLGYSGSDSAIIQEAADNELGSAPKSTGEVDWAYVSELSKLARKADMRYLFSMLWPDRDWQVFEGVSKDVLLNCGSHSGQFVAMCERSYGVKVAEHSRRVAEVAERDRWFSD